MSGETLQRMSDESMPEESDMSESPFSPDNAAALSLIMQMRIYDVLLGILDVLEDDFEKSHGKRPNVSDMIYEAHQAGTIVSGLPFFIPKAENEQ